MPPESKGEMIKGSPRFDHRPDLTSLVVGD